MKQIKLPVKDGEQLEKALQSIRAIPMPFMLTVQNLESIRSIQANALMWELLGQLEKRATWHGLKWQAEDWKDFFTAALRKEARYMPGYDGGVVLLGESTRKMGVEKFNQIIEFIYYFASESPDALFFDGFTEKPVPEQYKQYADEYHAKRKQV